MANSAITGPTLIDFPAGMIMPYAGSTTPAGWLECDGTEKDISAYPTLAAALGTTWNSAKNALTGAQYSTAVGKFRVPDMRGAFLRGSTGGANNQNGVATALAEFQDQKTKRNGLSATATQSAANVSGAKNQLNNGTGSASNTSWLIGVLGATSNAFSWGGHSLARGGTLSGNNGDGSFPGQDHTHSFSYSGNFSASGTADAQTIAVATGDAETRPDAVGVRYLIKF